MVVVEVSQDDLTTQHNTLSEKYDGSNMVYLAHLSFCHGCTPRKDVGLERHIPSMAPCEISLFFVAQGVRVPDPHNMIGVFVKSGRMHASNMVSKHICLASHNQALH